MTEYELKRIAYDLTMEFMHQNNYLKEGNAHPISERVEKFNQIYDEFYNELLKNHSTNL